MNAEQDRRAAAGTRDIGVQKSINLPNKLTLSRVIMVPLFVAILSIHHPIAYAIAYIIFIAATVTDYYDGKIARERNLITNFGQLFDPVADKVLLAAAFIMLMKLPELHVPGWTVVAILAREFLVTGARTVAASEGTVIAANKYGKAKTIIQMTYIFTFLFLAFAAFFVKWWAPLEVADWYLFILDIASYVGIVFVAGFTVYSGIQFLNQNWKALKLDQLS